MLKFSKTPKCYVGGAFIRSESGRVASPRQSGTQSAPEHSHGQSPARHLQGWMHLEQGQVWKKGDQYLRIVTWERMAIEFKSMTNLEAGEGPVQRVTKKEFCRIVKGATLHVPGAPVPPPEI